MKLLLVAALVGLAKAELHCDAANRDSPDCLASDHKSKFSTGDELRMWLEDIEDGNFLQELGSPDDISHIIEDSEDDGAACFTLKDVLTASKTNEDQESQPLASPDQLNGSGSLVFSDGTRLESTFFVNGQLPDGASGTLYIGDGVELALSGRILRGCLNGRVEGRETTSNKLVLVSNLERGVEVGPTWYISLSKYDLGLVGLMYQEKPDGQVAGKALTRFGPPFNFNGDRVTWIYPDYATAISGRWRGGEMFAASRVSLKGLTEGLNGVYAMNVSEPLQESPVWRRDVSNKTILSSDPFLKDPYEVQMVEVRESSIPKAGQGVFTLHDILKHSVIAYFNGIRLKETDVFNSAKMFKKKSPYIVEIGDEDDFLDIPSELASWDKYQASTGHKVNHNRVGNARYTECEHPRFGTILCLITIKDMKADSELFTQYDVAFNKEGMKSMLKTALTIGHYFSGKSKEQFIRDVKPYLESASRMAETIRIEDLINLSIGMGGPPE